MITLMNQDVSISLCMIARNEAANIRRAMTSVLPYVDEAIVIDDESTDKTGVVALSMGPKVQVFKSGVTERPAFPDIQKNVAIDKASSDIIIVLDCDEVLDADFEVALPVFVSGMMAGDYDSVGFIRRNYIAGVLQNPCRLDYQIRMWRTGLGIRSGENLHEGIVGHTNAMLSNIIIWHYKTPSMQDEDNRLYAELMESE
jgi:glycosyltransferase involved in cell wall biosynthesis